MMKPNLLTNSFKYKFYNTIMPFVYNIGAAVVIFGAMFKLLNLPGGSMMLGLGLSTEALIFLLSAFAPKEEEQTPHTLTQKFDQCLEKASVDISLLENLAVNMRRFSENMTNIPSFASVSAVTENYVKHVEHATQAIENMAKVNDSVGHALRSFISLSSDPKLTYCFTQMEEMAHTLTSMNRLYKKALADMEAQTTDTFALHDHLETALKAMEVAGSQAIHFKEELALLNQKVTALNEIYAKTLTAFKS